jgi:proteasome beta subunit
VYNNEKAKIMDGYGPQLPTLHQLPNIPFMPQVQEAPTQQQQPQPNTAQHGAGWIPGATTVGVVFHGGVILAAEKRVTYGGFIMSKSGKKVFKVTDRIGVACAGLVGDMQILAREMEAQANLYSMDTGRPISVRSASKLMANVLFNRRYAPLITQTIVGGLDEEGASIYVLDVLGSLIPDKYAAVGSGTETAIGVIEEGFKDNMPLKEVKDLCIRAIKAAINRDALSGDGIDIVVITKDGVTEESIKF